MGSRVMLESLAILRLNIERYQRMLIAEREPARRQQITSLLHNALLREAEAVGTQILAHERRSADRKRRQSAMAPTEPNAESEYRSAPSRRWSKCDSEPACWYSKIFDYSRCSS